MAVYTKLSEIDLVKFFSKYSIGKIQKHKEIKEGIENTNYFIQTAKGKFILTVFEKRLAVDYQLQRAIDLIRGVSLYQETIQ